MTVPFSHLKKIVFDGGVCQKSLVTMFITYMEAHGESEAHPLNEDVSIRILGNPTGFPPAVYQFCQRCRRIDVAVETVIFGERPQESPSPASQTVFNPDVSQFTIPMSRLKQVIVAAESHDGFQVGQFLTYAVNW